LLRRAWPSVAAKPLTLKRHSAVFRWGNRNEFILIEGLMMKKIYERPELQKRERVAMIVASVSNVPLP
jgi:hypothetical protein